MFKKFNNSLFIVTTFFISASISIALTFFFVEYNLQQKHLSVQKLSSSYVSLIRNNVFQAISATYPLAALIRTQKGDVKGFTELATEMLPLYPGAAALQLHPDGILKYVVPLKGNEGAIGHNLLLNPQRAKEAFLARDTGNLTLAGPFNLVQGGIGAAARLPIFLNNSQGSKLFWGFSTVLFRFPEVLDAVHLDSLVAAGFAYELSRIHPDTHKIQIIARSKEALIERPEQFTIAVPNGVWTFKVSPITAWHSQSFIILMASLAALFTFLTTFSALLIQRLRNNKKQLEKQVLERTKELSDNLKRLDTALNAAHQGWFDFNVKHNECLVSDKVPLLLGYKPSEFISNFQEWKNNIHSEDRDIFLNSFNQCIETGRSIDIEYRRKAKDGSWLWIHTTGEIVERCTNNTPQRLIGIHTDVSERKRSEQVLRVLAEGGAIEDGDIFQLMVKQLASAQNVRYVFIALVAPDDMDTAETITVWGGDNYIENLSYALEESPCQNVIQQGVCFYPEHIQQLFPNDQLLTDIGAESYLGVPLKNSKNEVIGLVVVIDDKPMVEKSFTITLLESLAARAAIELERIESDKKMQLSAKVFNDAHEAIIITDTTGSIIEINPTFCEITGYERTEVLGKNPSILSSGKQSREFYQEMWQSITEQGHWRGEVWNRKKNGEVYAELLTISSIQDEHTHNTTHYVGLFSDITKSKEQQSTLELMAHYDVLTQLPNRVLFADRFSLAIAHSTRSATLLAVCFLDLDNFKPINDNHGHNVGDQLLVEVAQRIVASIRGVDTVSRQGGDEFTLLLNDIESYEQCEHTVKRILYALAQPFLIGDYVHNITASIGVTLYPDDNEDIDTLIRHADNAMYQAKQSGKHRYHFFDRKQDQQLIQKHHRLAEIEQALVNNEMTLYYQPKVNMATGKVFGAEALIRWNHPEKGLIPPLDFLPLIDGTDLELQVGNWVINHALQQMNNWLAQGIKLEVSINIASDHLQSKSFFTQLKQALSKYPAVNPKQLQLEILESSALSDLQMISRIIKTCQESLGVTIALDDFGTGYSSLTHLRSLTANTIKIDQSFVRDMLDDPSDYMIIDGVIRLADSFGREVIAEGVETTRHGLMLLIMGCKEAQGYDISRPMPADDLPAWLLDYKPNEEWLAYGSTRRTAKENKIKLLRLITEHWITFFVSNIQSAPKDINHWPIMGAEQDHCGQWIKRAEKEQLFEPEGLDLLGKTHDEFHAIAQAIQSQYQEGNVDVSRKGLASLQSAFDEMNHVLRQCE